jgi:hypothetical protein
VVAAADHSRHQISLEMAGAADQVVAVPVITRPQLKAVAEVSCPVHMLMQSGTQVVPAQVESLEILAVVVEEVAAPVLRLPVEWVAQVVAELLIH